MSIEIERKFLLEQFPHQEMEHGKIKVLSRQTFEQTYLALTDQQELRVRKIEEVVEGQISKSFVHTFKEGQGLSRKEIEYEISEDLYQQLLQGRKPLEKVRTKVLFEDIVMEIDEYTGFDLLTVEVEFNSEDEAHLFTPPAWFGAEVGSEKEYRNKTLWVSLQNNHMDMEEQEYHLSKEHSQILSRLAETLNSAKIGWAVGSSQLLALYGMVDQPRDIDILIEESDTERAEQLLVQLGQQRELASKKPFLTKRFYQLIMNQTEVDVMCGFRIEHHAGVFDYPFDRKSISITKQIEGQTVPFTYLEDWYVLYSLIPEREHRVQAIEKYWSTQGIEHPKRLERFLDTNIPEFLKTKVRKLSKV